jgi:hypothetical protein
MKKEVIEGYSLLELLTKAQPYLHKGWSLDLESNDLPTSYAGYFRCVILEPETKVRKTKEDKE